MMYFEVLFILAIYFTIFFFIGAIKKDNSIIDRAWGSGFVLSAWYLCLRNENLGIKGILVTLFITIWGLRLTYHITRRNAGKAEDYRYISLRKAFGEKFFLLKVFFFIYMLQMLVQYVVTIPLIYTSETAQSLQWFNYFGVLLWAIGFFFEAYGDYQLKKFKKDSKNKGKLMQSGLWSLTRHPNYFGDSLMWFGITVLAVSNGKGVWIFIGPMVMTFFIVFVSGVRLLEKKYEARADFAEYKKKTSAFIPFVSGKDILIYITSMIFFLTLDVVWLLVIAKNLYKQELGSLMNMHPNIAAAVSFYFIFLIGLLVFVIKPALVKQNFKYALFLGMFFGFVTYATYDLTNLATLNGWSQKMTVLDLIWGSFVCGTVSVLTYVTWKNAFKKLGKR